MNNFKDMKYFSGPIFGELNICSDKCAGQKKNKIYIWYILWIVEKVLFYRVKGRLPLQLMKVGYHKIYIFTYE